MRTYLNSKHDELPSHMPSLVQLRQLSSAGHEAQQRLSWTDYQIRLLVPKLLVLIFWDYRNDIRTGINAAQDLNTMTGQTKVSLTMDQTTKRMSANNYKSFSWRNRILKKYPYPAEIQNLGPLGFTGA